MAETDSNASTQSTDVDRRDSTQYDRTRALQFVADMSKGPGRIERAIRQLFDAHPDLAFVTDELCEHCYPDKEFGWLPP
jgi:hypothetical protein